jgi:hypothetical protein
MARSRAYNWMDYERIVRTVLQGKIDGKRKQGRPKATWADTVEERSQHTLAHDRESWKKLGLTVGVHIRPNGLRATKTKQTISTQVKVDDT